jgi:hypothetical protein
MEVSRKYELKNLESTANTIWMYVMTQLIKKKKLRGLSPQANYTDRATAAVGEVVPTFAGRGCYVVSATDSYGR